MLSIGKEAAAEQIGQRFPVFSGKTGNLPRRQVPTRLPPPPNTPRRIGGKTEIPETFPESATFQRPGRLAPAGVSLRDESRLATLKPPVRFRPQFIRNRATSIKGRSRPAPA